MVTNLQFSERESSGSSNAARPLSSLPPYLSFLPCCPAINGIIRIIKVKWTSLVCFCPNRQSASANTPDLDIFLLVRIHCSFHALTHDDLLCMMDPLSHANTFGSKLTLIPIITSVFAGTLQICWFAYSVRAKNSSCARRFDFFYVNWHFELKR